MLDGGRVVGHGRAMKEVETMEERKGRRLEVERQGVILICTQRTSFFGHSVVSRFWMVVCDSQ